VSLKPANNVTTVTTTPTLPTNAEPPAANQCAVMASSTQARNVTLVLQTLLLDLATFNASGSEPVLPSATEVNAQPARSLPPTQLPQPAHPTLTTLEL